MKKYPAEAIHHLTRHVMKDTASFNWLMNHGYKELVAVLDAIRDDKRAFKYLLDNKYVELAAFVNSIWDDGKAFRFLFEIRAYDWAACANIVNGDDKAELALKKAKKEHFVLLAHAIQSRIHEDGDRNVSPIGVIKNMFNFKKAFSKDADN